MNEKVAEQHPQTQSSIENVGKQPKASASDDTIAAPKQLKRARSTELEHDTKQETKRRKLESEPSNVPSQPTIRLRETQGDIFAAPRNTLLIHACNCEGSWGAGIAAAFRKNYPNAFNIYKSHCTRKGNGHSLLGQALLIPPQAQDRRGHFIGCLFTSRSKGRKKDGPGAILEATSTAFPRLMERVSEWNREKGDSSRVQQETQSANTGAKLKPTTIGEGEPINQVRMCKINSGLFAVPWERTKAVMEDATISSGNIGTIEVISRD